METRPNTHDELLRLLLAAEEMAGVGHWYLNIQTQQLHWSNEVFRIHGHEPDHYIPNVEQAIMAYHPADRNRISQAVEKGVENGQPWNEEARLIRTDGEIRDVLAKGEPHYEQGELVALFGVFQDITEQKEQRLYFEQLSRVVELTQEGIIITDIEGKVTWVNHGFEQISGYNLEEIKGKKPGPLLQGEDTDAMTQKYMSDMIASRRPFSTEVLNYHKNGSPYWLKLNIYPQYDSNGELQSFMAVETDITQSKLAQQQLEHQALILQKEIQRRESLEHELRQLAYSDGLTGLYNRRYFFQVFDAELSRCRRYHRDLSLILLDIDYFKRVNDAFGHDVGDQVLVDVAHCLKNIAREGDIVARVGGEEFAILAIETDLQAAAHLAERLRLGLCEQVKISGSEQNGGNVGIGNRVTASFGVTSLATHHSVPNCLNNSAKAYKRADEALYQSKQDGRNRVTLAPPLS